MSVESYDGEDYLAERRDELEGYNQTELDQLTDEESVDGSEPLSPLSPVLAAASRGDAQGTAAAIAAAGPGWREDRTWRFRTSMHMAARCGSVRTMEVLMASGCRADGGSGDLWESTPLQLAARAGHMAAVRWLADADADLVTSSNRDGETALTMAVRNGRVDVSAFLLSRGANACESNDNGECALTLAGSVTSAICRTVLAGALCQGATNPDRLAYMLILTARAGRADVTERLLEEGAPHDVALDLPDDKGAMEAAVTGKNPSAVVPVLIAGGCSVGLLPPADAASGRAALDVLCLRGRNQDMPAISALLAAGADVNHRNSLGVGCTALDCAVRVAHVRAVQKLLEHGANVNLAGGTLRRTALHWAAAELRPSVCLVLLSAHADASAQDRDGATPLELALSALDVIKLEVGPSREQACVQKLAAARRTVACLRKAAPGGAGGGRSDGRS